MLLLGSRHGEVEAVRASRDLPGLAGFDHELGVLAARARPGTAAGVKAPNGKRAWPDRSARPRRLACLSTDAVHATWSCVGPYTFKHFEVWRQEALKPPPTEAMKLLHRLAADPGILGVMRKHSWTVQRLSEMPPEGKVGVSPVCILGVNIGAGQEISLRLRTDDLKVSSRLILHID